MPRGRLCSPGWRFVPQWRLRLLVGVPDAILYLGLFLALPRRVPQWRLGLPGWPGCRLGLLTQSDVRVLCAPVACWGVWTGRLCVGRSGLLAREWVGVCFLFPRWVPTPFWTPRCDLSTLAGGTVSPFCR